MSGYKASMDDRSKLPHALIPKSYNDAVARALQYGAVKYAPHNWRKGLPWGEVYSALQRHLLAWWSSEETDSESGLHHLDHAGACLAFLTEYVAQERYVKYDDRYKEEK